MREKTIKTMTDNGVPEARATKIWETLRDRCNGGDELTEHDVAVLKDDHIRKAFESNPAGGEHLLKALGRAGGEEKKGRKFKPEKAKGYSGAELISFIVADPKTDGLYEETMRRTKGAPFRFVVDGKTCEEESGDRLDALRDNAPVADFVRVNGKKVEPVGYPTDAAIEDDEDPFERGVALGQPDMVSKRLNVSLAKISFEAKQALAVACELDLSDASEHELRKAAKAAEGKSQSEVVSQYDLTADAWDKRKGNLPKLKVARRPAPSVGLETSSRPFEAPATEGARGGQVTGAPKLAALPGAVDIYLSASPKDAAWRDRIAMAFAGHEKAGQVVVDHEGLIRPGQDRSKVLRAFETRARIVLLLLTADYLASDEQDAERRRSLARADKGEIIVIPVYVKPCSWKPIFDGTIKAIPEKAITTFSNPDEALCEVVTAVEACLPASAAFEPPWLDICPVAFADPGLQRFMAACVRAYGVANAERACMAANMHTHNIDFRGSANAVWADVVEKAASQARLRALYEHARRDPLVSAHFREWQ